MKILITGIDSFTGFYLEESLRNCGFDIFGTSNLKSSDDIFHLDICNYSSTREILKKVKPNIIIHLAAVSHVAHEVKDEIYISNIIGTRNLLECFREIDINDKSFIFPSTANVYKPTKDLIFEDSLIKPINDYAISKLACENILHLYKEHFNCTILRFFNYTGVLQSDKFLVPKIVNHFREKKHELHLGDLEISRDFSDVRDIAEIYKYVVHDPEELDLINVCSGQEISIKEIVETCKKISGHDIEVKSNPEFKRKNEIKNLLGSTSKVGNIIPDNKRIKFNETLEWMLNAV